MTVKMIVQVILWFWFLGCITTYRFGDFLLVEGMGVRSAEFVMLCMYTGGLVLDWIVKAAGERMLLVILCFWLIVQFFYHWYFTIFGASERKLKGYNRCFEGTLRIWPMSEKRLIPDLYHIVLHGLILVNIILCVL